MSENKTIDSAENVEKKDEELWFYRIEFRQGGQQFTASGSQADLIRGTGVMAQTDHGQEPASIVGLAPVSGCHGEDRQASFEIERLLNRDEQEKYINLAQSEKRAFGICNDLVTTHQLHMRLVRVERYFNGSKMIFYFTADNRVDFRALVKDLVQEFRTRVEMRQVGVRHETKMIGGMGTCGRELCCSSFIKKFDSVSIKMAKEQDLPLNPTKISGVCNRLLCCLTYEYETYKKQRKKMPKPGKHIRVDGIQYRVKRQMPLREAIIVQNGEGEESILEKNAWKAAQIVKKVSNEKKKEKKSSENTEQNKK